MQERGIYSWSTANWKRRVLLQPDPKYAGKKLVAGLLAVSGVSAGLQGLPSTSVQQGRQQAECGPAFAQSMLRHWEAVAEGWRLPLPATGLLGQVASLDSLFDSCVSASGHSTAGPAPHGVLDAPGQEHGAHGAHRACGGAQR